MRYQRYTGAGLLILAIGAALVSLLGPLGLDVIDWRIAPNTENQVIGQDLVTLLMVAPLAATAGVLWLRGHRLAPPIAIGPAAYGLYTFLSYILSPDYHRYAGNNEKLFPLLLLLTILSWASVVAAWSAIQRSAPAAIPDRARKTLGGALLLVSALFVLAWGQQVTQVITGSSVLPEYQDDPGTFWVIKTFDLAFVMPLAIFTGIGLLGNRAAAIRLAHAVAGFFTLMSAAVSAMGIMMLARDDPAATVVLPAVTLPMTVVIGALTVSLWRVRVSAGRPEPERQRVPGRRVQKTTATLAPEHRNGSNR